MKTIKPALFCLAFLTVLACLASAVNITVNAGTTLLSVPQEVYGNNMAAWTASNNGTDTTYVTAMQASGCRNIRWPGGSWADIVDWDDTTCSGSCSTPAFISFLQEFGGTMQPICNFSGYWCGTQFTHSEAVSRAAAWVAWNMTNAGSARAKYWEIGNEDYGIGWEQGATNGTTYGQEFIDYYNAMKAVDPTILIGAVASPGAADYNSWTPDMLTAAKTAGVVPDFLIIHNYPYTPNPATGTAADAYYLSNISLVASQTKSLNSIVSQYLGSSYVGQVKYFMTEYNINNNNGAGPTPPINEYINAMYCAQWIMECAKNGWLGCNLWDVKNGGSPDFGFLSLGDVPYPNYYVFPMLSSKFGVNMVSCTSDDPSVNAYAAMDLSDNLSIFMVNNNPTSSNTASITMNGFTPMSSGLAWVMLPQGTPASGAPQEAPGIQINAVANPAPSDIASIAGQPISTGTTFSATLQANEMLLMVIPCNCTPTNTFTITPTYTITPTFTITPTSTITPTFTITPVITPGISKIYPDPVRDTFTYAFNIPEDSNIEISIYTFAMRLVDRLNFNESAGSHFVEIDTVKDKNLANGLYYIAYKQKGKGSSSQRVDAFLVER